MFQNDNNHKERLSQRIVKGGFWVFSLRLVHRLFSLARIVILARILAPHDFGLMGMAMLTMATLETFSQTGFQHALIQKKDNVESYLNSAWTVSILRGIILFGILYCIAPIAANFFKVPEAKSIIQVIGFSVLFQAFTNIGVIYFQKELEFNKQFIYQLSGTLADFIVAVSAAFILKSVWALVFGLLTGNFVRCIVSYIIHPYKPHLSSDLGKAKELFGFGKWIFGSSILIFLITQGDDIFVGKLLGATALGFYQMAYMISNIPATEITHVISQVSFPAYSKLQDNIPKLREAYLKVLQVTSFLSFPIAGLIFVLAPDFTEIFLGEKWMPIVPAMQILCIFGVARSISFGPLFYSVSKPDFVTKITSYRLILLIIIIYPLTIKYGIVGTAFSVLMSHIVFAGYAAAKAINIIKCKKLEFIQQIIFPVIGIVGMILFIIKLKNFLNIIVINIFYRVIFSILGGTLIYLLILLLIEMHISYSPLKNLRFFIKGKINEKQ